MKNGNDDYDLDLHNYRLLFGAHLSNQLSKNQFAIEFRFYIALFISIFLQQNEIIQNSTK